MSVPSPIDTGSPVRRPTADAEEGRLWEHRLHEDIMFNERQNFFLVAQAMLAAAFASALTASHPALGVARIIALSGLLIALVWATVNVRSIHNIKNVHERVLSSLPEFAETYKARRRPMWALKLIGFGIPPLMAGMWIALVVVA
jgi:hypothetical protein